MERILIFGWRSGLPLRSQQPVPWKSGASAPRSIKLPTSTVIPNRAERPGEEPALGVCVGRTLLSVAFDVACYPERSRRLSHLLQDMDFAESTTQKAKTVQPGQPWKSGASAPRQAIK